MLPDGGALNRLVRHRDRQAFAELVRQNIHLVYGAACRQVGTGHADDITQAVFCLLWEKPSKVGGESHLAGWLVNATRLVARQWNRTEGRRRRRELIAASCRAVYAEDVLTPDAQDLSPVLDEALSELGSRERTAVVLRYLQDKSVDEVARTMGITPVAAAKRLSRGLGRLREALSQRGRAMDAASLTSTMVLMGQQTPMANTGLADQIVVHALAKSSVVAAGYPLKTVLGLHISKWSAVAACVLTAVGLSGGFFLLTHGTIAAAQAADAKAPTAAASQPKADGPIKVGVTLSRLTAITKNPSGKLWGYKGQTRVVIDLTAPDVKLYPVIEPGTQDDADLKAQLETVFDGAAPIDGSDVKALKQLDVLVANEDWMVPDSELKAVDKAVSEGMGLINIGGMGWASPGLHGHNPSPGRLTGMTEVQGGYTNGVVACKVVNAHEIMGDFAPEGPVHFRLLGMYGILPADAIPLIQATDSSVMIPRGPSADDVTKFVCYPLYISHLEKGKIVGIGYGPYSTGNRQQPSELLLRSVHFLAGRRQSP